MNLQEQTNRIKQMMGLITETSEEEAYELLGQEHPVISKLVKDKGYTEESLDKLISIIDDLPEETFVTTFLGIFFTSLTVFSVSNSTGLVI